MAAKVGCGIIGFEETVIIRGEIIDAASARSACFCLLH